MGLTQQSLLVGAQTILLLLYMLGDWDVTMEWIKNLLDLAYYPTTAKSCGFVQQLKYFSSAKSNFSPSHT